MSRKGSLQRLDPLAESGRLRANTIDGRKFEECQHHFRISLLTEVNGLRSVRIALIANRIIVVGDNVHPCALRPDERSFGPVWKLPVEVVRGQVEKRLLTSAGIDSFHEHVLTAQVHV